MPWEKQQLVDQVEIGQQAQAVQEIRSENKTVIRLIVNHMPDADQFRMAGDQFQLSLNFRRAQIHPSHHPGDERVLVRQ